MGFGLIEVFVFGWDFPIAAKMLTVFGGADPLNCNFNHSDPQKALPWTKPRLMSGNRIWAKSASDLGASGREKKKGEHKSQNSDKPHPCGGATAQPTLKPFITICCPPRRNHACQIWF